MLILRRLLLLWLFMFWQGGFLFYGAVVVSIGADLLGDLEQGMITRRVTAWLNIIGLAVLAAWVGDLLCEPGTRLKRRWAAWLLLLASLALLAWLHAQLEGHIDPDRSRLLDRPAFRQLHRWYLRVSTAQWIVSVVFTLWTLQNWRARDQGHDFNMRTGGEGRVGDVPGTGTSMAK